MNEGTIPVREDTSFPNPQEWKIGLIAYERMGYPIQDEHGNNITTYEGLKVGMTVHINSVFQYPGHYVTQVTEINGDSAEVAHTHAMIVWDKQFNEWVNLGFIDDRAIAMCKFD